TTSFVITHSKFSTALLGRVAGSEAKRMALRHHRPRPAHSDRTAAENFDEPESFMSDKQPTPPPTLRWSGTADEGHLKMIDQTRLPGECTEIDCRTVEDVWEAIKSLRVRGAPAIGVAAAYGVVIGLQQLPADASDEQVDRRLKK